MRLIRATVWGVVIVAVCGLAFHLAYAQPSSRETQLPTESITNSIGMQLVLVPAGEFLMGALDTDELARMDEKPQHHVRIGRSFYLAAHEVTIGQFGTFVTQTGFKTAAETDGKGASGYDSAERGFEYNSAKYSWRNTGYPQDDKHPVVDVNWHDAQAFCDWLSRKEARKYRLPTEAEWEYSCRAGTKTRFTTGDAPQGLASVANVCDQSLSKHWDLSTLKFGANPKSITFQSWDDGFAFTAPVGSFQPNAFGLYDMLGNVGEFCRDWYQNDYYRESGELDPKGPVKKREGHVIRGGTFLNGTTLVRATSRIECPDAYRNYVIGFRVLMETGESDYE
jgi:formylglycine-generating enzyme required for sulfatase activity